MPVRVGPAARALCTLSPWPRQAHLSPTLGSSLGLPLGHLARLLGQTTWWFSWLRLEAAHPDALPGQRAESRWGQGCHRPQPTPLYPCNRGYFCGYFKCGVTNLFWGGCTQQGRLEPQDVVCSVVGWCSHPHPSPPTQIKARILGFISVLFSRCAGNTFAGEGWRCLRQ